MYEETMTEISDDNRFEWDSDKNEKNKAKHGLSFEQILPVFDDPYFLERYDSAYSSEAEVYNEYCKNINS